VALGWDEVSTTPQPPVLVVVEVVRRGLLGVGPALLQELQLEEKAVTSLTSDVVLIC